MRALASALLVSLLLPAAAIAQPSNAVSLFLTDVTGNGSAEKPDWYGGFGAAWSRMFGKAIALELSASTENRRTYDYVVNPADGSIIPVQKQDITIHPIMATGKYIWANDSRWTPDLGAGLRYVAAPDADPRFGYKDHLTLAIVGGVTFHVTPSFGILAEATVNTGDKESYDPPFRIATGVSWRF